MTHLLVHLVKEIGILRPVFLRNMFPFERFFPVLKKYVRNRACLEGSITKGYMTKEVIEFCVDYVIRYKLKEKMKKERKMKRREMNSL
jgi:hypothetical protein